MTDQKSAKEYLLETISGLRKTLEQDIKSLDEDVTSLRKFVDASWRIALEFEENPDVIYRHGQKTPQAMFKDHGIAREDMHGLVEKWEHYAKLLKACQMIVSSEEFEKVLSKRQTKREKSNKP